MNHYFKKLLLVSFFSLTLPNLIQGSENFTNPVTEKINASLLDHNNLETLRKLYSLQALIAGSMISYQIFKHPSISPYINSLDVKTVYPFAQQWYDDMTVKYPIAHLDTKSFKIAPVNHSFESSINEILFPVACLKDINVIYEKYLNQETLEEFETLFLYRIEFLLLHEAAHIEHNDLIKRLISPIVMYLGAETIITFIGSSFHVDNIDWIRTKIENQDLSSSTSTTAYLVATGLYLSYVGKVTTNLFSELFNAPYIRNQEEAADDFALQHGDTNSLKGALQFFQLVDEIEIILQNPEHPDYTTAVFFKENPTWRWIFDTLQDKNHPQPSARALKFQQELDRRLQAEQL